MGMTLTKEFVNSCRNVGALRDFLCQAIDQVDEKNNEIAELKAENERLKKCEVWMKQHFYCEEVIACESAKNRRLKRALWLARDEWARSSALSYHLIESHPNKDIAATYKRKANKWEKVKDKCLKKAEEYK